MWPKYCCGSWKLGQRGQDLEKGNKINTKL